MGGLLGVFVILFLIVTWVPRNHMLLATTPWPVYFAAIGLGLIGMALGYGLPRCCGRTRAAARTIALETGIQNGPLAVLIVLLTFTGDHAAAGAADPGAVLAVHRADLERGDGLVPRITTREELARDQAKVPHGAVAAQPLIRRALVRRVVHEVTSNCAGAHASRSVASGGVVSTPRSPNQPPTRAASAPAPMPATNTQGDTT
jgi:hypothetical protein